jgi:phosphoglycolate phosphatase-like HAD superfamily hydrolase
MKPARAVLLDLDRTLIDLQSFTNYSAARADVEALVGTWSDGAVPATDWDHDTQACMAVLHACGTDPRWGQISDVIAVHERAAIPHSTLMATVQESRSILTALPTAVVTLLPTDVATDVLAFHDLLLGREIDVVIGRQQELPPKPEPDGVLQACRQLSVDPTDAVMIGDSTWDAQAALAAGVAFIGVPPDGFPEVIRSQITTAPTLAAALARAGADATAL